MNISTKVLATALFAAIPAAISANTLTSPDPSAVYETGSLATVDLFWADEVEYPEGKVTLLDASGAEVSKGSVSFYADFSVYNAYTVSFKPVVTEAGEYTMVIPANLDPNGNEEYRISVLLKENDAPVCVPSAVTPEPGSNLVQGTTDFSTIRLEFDGEKAGISVNFDLIKLTASDGTVVEYKEGGIYDPENPMFQYTPCPFITLSFNNDGTLPSGDYTLTVPAGAIESQRGPLETTLSYTWNYTKTIADADPTPLELISGMFGKATYTYSQGVYTYEWIGEDAVPFENGMSIGQLTSVSTPQEGREPGSAFLLDFNHGHKTNYLEYTVTNITDNQYVTSGSARKMEDGKFLLAWSSNTKFLEGNEYEFMFHAYSNDGQPRAEFGNGLAIKVNGSAEAYKFSSAQFVATAPADKGMIRTAEDNKITVVFNAPVKARATLNEGFGTSSDLPCESKDGDEFDAVWFITLTPHAMGSNTAEIAIFAEGEDGLVVYGQQGHEETACNQITLFLQVSQPRALLGNSDSHIAGIDTLSFYSENDGQAIQHSWMALPYITDSKGNTVATAISEYAANNPDNPDFLEPAKIIRSKGEGYDLVPLELEYKFEPAVTEPGRYTLHLPDAMLNFGTEFESISSVPQQYSLWVVEFADVTYTVDNHSIKLPSVEKGKSAEIDLTVADNWTLESLTLNGEDVTADVNNGHYITPALQEAAEIAATFAYDGEVIIPVGVDDVVSDLNLRGWSENGRLYVAGLKSGQTVNVYSIGGSLMTSMSISDSDTIEINVPVDSAYIVTVTEGTTTVALKLFNK